MIPKNPIAKQTRRGVGNELAKSKACEGASEILTNRQESQQLVSYAVQEAVRYRIESHSYTNTGGAAIDQQKEKPVKALPRF